jgi:hypothetical protein
MNNRPLIITFDLRNNTKLIHEVCLHLLVEFYHEVILTTWESKNYLFRCMIVIM